MMLKLSFFIILLFLPQILFSQEEKYPFSKWSQEILDKANTAKDVTYMTEEEKEVIFLCNLARMDGKLFSETYLKQYIDSMEVEKNSYVTSLFSTLKKNKKTTPLQPAEELYNVAKNHAEDSGKKGTIGHQNVTSRFKKYAPDYQDSAENCDYGNSEAIDIVMSLLIDDGVPDKGHRENILDKDLKYVGVAIRKHKKYEYNCVMDFGNI